MQELQECRNRSSNSDRNKKPNNSFIKQYEEDLGDGNRLREGSPGYSGRDSGRWKTPPGSLSGLYLMVIFAMSFTIFICDFLSDMSTADLFRTQNKMGEYYATFTLAVLPITVINFFSFILYLHEEPSRRISMIWIIRIFSHISHMAVFQRRLETLCKKLRYHCLAQKNVYLKQALHSDVIRENQRTAILILIQSFLHDLPQLVLQSCIFIRTIFHNLETEDNEIQCSDLCIAQLKSIFFSTMSLILSVMNYHDSERLSMGNKVGTNKDHFLLYLYQWMWLTGITGSRIFAFSMAVANINLKIALTYLAIISFHWLVYTIYFKNRNEGKPVAIEFCSRQVPTSIQILMENARDWSLGIVHTFCFLDHFDSIWKDSIEIKTFNYLIFGEDTMFLIVWYFKSTAHFHTEQRPWIWIYTAALGYYYGSFFMGIATMILYFKKLKQVTFFPKCEILWNNRQS